MPITPAVPPRTNALWRSNRGRVPGPKHYSQWRHKAGWELATRRSGLILGYRHHNLSPAGLIGFDLLTADRVIADPSDLHNRRLSPARPKCEGPEFGGHKNPSFA